MPKFQIKYTMHMLSRNKIKSPEEQKLGEGGDDKQVIKLTWPNLMAHMQHRVGLSPYSSQLQAQDTVKIFISTIKNSST